MKMLKFVILLGLLKLCLSAATPAGKLRLPSPGYGWDFLTESIRYPPVKISYADNQLTPEGDYLVPDCMHVDPIKETIFGDSSDVTESRRDYKSKTTTSLSASVSMSGLAWKVSGAYSTDSQKMAMSQEDTKTVTITTKLIDNRYHMMTSSKCPLDSAFEAWIEEMDYYLETNNLFLVEELADNLINEYGSHYLRKVKVGGLLYIDDYLSTKFYMDAKESSKVENIKAAASASFGALFKISADVAINNGNQGSQLEQFGQQTKKRVVNALGGKYNPGMAADEWAKTLVDNYVAVDREVDYISNLVSYTNFPKLNRTRVLQIRSYIQASLGIFGLKNTKFGCMDRKSIHFDFTATHHNESMCEEEVKFGGVHAQTFDCVRRDEYDVCIETKEKCLEPNFFTKGRNCSTGYKEGLVFINSSPKLNLYECLGNKMMQNGVVLFGGIYSRYYKNPVTNQFSCPETFEATSLFGCGENTVCVSKDFDKSVYYAVPFGGFQHVCRNRLPQCPERYRAFPITTIDDCELYYCSIMKETELPGLVRPPYVMRKLSAEAQQVIERLKSLNRDKVLPVF